MMPEMTTSVNTNSYTTATSNTSGSIWGATDADLNAEIVEAGEDPSSLGKNEFLKLLLAQMQHQDPLNPTDNTEFVAQLAQFSSLEQMTSMNTNLESMIAANATIASSINNSMLVSYIGKNVDATSNYFNFDGESPVDLKFYLEDDSVIGQLDILDANGTVVRSFELGEMNAGVNEFEWDGLTKYGTTSTPGGYYYSIEAYDILSESINVTPKFKGTVDGVTYIEGEAFLKIGEIMIPFASVVNISEGE